MDLVNVGNAYTQPTGAGVRIVDGELVDEMIDVWSLDRMDVRLFANNVGNVHAPQVYISEGELVDELLDVAGKLPHSTINLSVQNLGNVHINSRSSDGHLRIAAGQLVDEILDVSDVIESATITMDLESVGNLYCTGNPIRATFESRDSTGLVAGPSELMDSVVDVLMVDAANFNLRLNECANTQASMDFGPPGGQLMKEVVDISVGGSPRLNITSTRTAELRQC
jgi:hypothetical protein